MEAGALDTSSNVSAEGDNLIPDSDLYDVDSYDTPDPGLLLEKNGDTPTPPHFPLESRSHQGSILSGQWNFSRQFLAGIALPVTFRAASDRTFSGYL